MTKETQTTNTATVSTAKKTESQHLEEKQRDKEVGLEDIRRLMKDAYQQGFMDAVAWMQRPESELQ